jgi:SAM-dependent methyltransferase
MNKQKATWPKRVSILTSLQSRIANDWTRYWLQTNRNKFSHIIDFGHQFVIQSSRAGFLRTLEIGAGLGEHLDYETLTDEQTENYVSLELNKDMASIIRKRWRRIKAIVGDCQEHIPYPDGYFDRIIAIHVLEHLPNLPAFLGEANRLLNKDHGQLLVVIPCEGGLGYTLGRRFTSQRIFEKRYKQSYKPYIQAEHVNQASEVLFEIKKIFSTEWEYWYPLRIPSIHLNLCVGLTLKFSKR